MNEQPEYWMRGSIDGVPGLLQPVAHALLQMSDELKDCLKSINSESLWLRPKGVASVGFHTLHICGVVDRMFTYAEGKSLSEEQFEYLKQETFEQPEMTIQDMIEHVNNSITSAIEKLKKVLVEELTEVMYLGRKKLEVTLIGLLFHSAEHSMRHLGQALVTAKVL